MKHAAAPACCEKSFWLLQLHMRDSLQGDWDAGALARTKNLVESAHAAPKQSKFTTIWTARSMGTATSYSIGFPEILVLTSKAHGAGLIRMSFRLAKHPPISKGLPAESTA